MPWHGTLVPCVRNWRDDFLFSLQAHCTSDNLCWPPRVAWRSWKYVWIFFATPYFLKKPCKNLAVRTSVDFQWVHLQLTSLYFWIFCFINCSGTLDNRARFRTWIENKGWFCPKIFGYMSVLRCHFFWNQLGASGLHPIQSGTTGQSRCLPKLLFIVYSERLHALHTAALQFFMHC